MELIKPEVPDAQKNRGPDIFLEGLRGGLAAFAQFAQIRRQSESDAARLAFAERQAQQNHELDKQKMLQDYELKDRQLSNEEELLPTRKLEMEAHADYYTITKGAKTRQSAAKIATLNDFNKQVMKYGLDDPNPNDLSEFYAKARRLKDEFGFADIPVIKHTLKQIDLRTKEHTVPLTINARKKDDDGNVVSELQTKMVPVGEIIEGLKDPKKYDHVMQTLERSGLLDEKASGNKYLREVIQAETKKTESGKGTDFKRGESRVEPGGVLSEPAVPEDVDESDLFGSIGQTEKYLAHARAALQRGAAPKAVAERLNSFGIDPNQLWAT